MRQFYEPQTTFSQPNKTMEKDQVKKNDGRPCMKITANENANDQSNSAWTPTLGLHWQRIPVFDNGSYLLGVRYLTFCAWPLAQQG